MASSLVRKHTSTYYNTYNKLGIYVWRCYIAVVARANRSGRVVRTQPQKEVWEYLLKPSTASFASNCLVSHALFLSENIEIIQ